MVMEQNCISESIWGAMGDEIEKENVREWKILKQHSIHEYNIVHCTVSYWTLGEYGDREWVSNGGERVNLIKAKKNTDLKFQDNPPLDYQYTIKKMKDRREK
jgi:hypothetical protein